MYRSMVKGLWPLLAVLFTTPALAQDPGNAEPSVIDSGPSTPHTPIPGKVETGIVEGQQPEREERIIVDTPAVEYTFTTRSGTLSKAVLKDARFTHAGRAPVAGAPAEKLAEGQIDLVSTWGTKWLPFGSDFGKLSYPGTATLSIRRAKEGPVQGGSVRNGVLEMPAQRELLALDRPIAVNDILKVTAPASIVGEYSVAAVGAGGSITPSKPFTESTVTGVTYEVIRVGSVSELYDSNRAYTRVSEKPGLPLVYVWPNPEFDASPVWIERRLEAGSHPYELKLAVTVHNVGDQLAQVQNGIVLGAWQHPDAKGPSMFGGPTPVLQASCLALDGMEHAPFTALREAAVEKWEAGQAAREARSYPTGAQWISTDTNYFMQAAVPTPVTELGGQCQLGFDDFNPTVPGAWVMWAKYWGSKVEQIPRRESGCLPDWLSAKNPSAPQGERCKASLEVLGVDEAASIDEVKRAWEAKRAAGAEVASVDQAYEVLKNRRQATWRFNLYDGPKDVSVMSLTHPELKRSVKFGWISFIGAPMHWVLVKFHEGLGSWPIAIILLTIALKLITWPLSQKSYMSMQKMKNIKPKLDELKAKLGGDKQRFAQEQMALMKREGVNPLAGCLPMLLQLPIWVGLYGAILGSVELYHEPLGLWVPDLSSPDPFFVMPVLVGIIQFVQMWLTPQTSTDEMQAKIMKYGMPVMFTVFMLFLPSALVLYILVNSLLTIGQNLLIKRKMEARA